MKIFLACGAIILSAGLAACSPAPSGEPAAPEAAAPAPAPAPAGPAPASVAEAVMPETLIGRWGVTETACAPSNDTGDGLFEISAGKVAAGLDECTVSSVTPEGAGVHVVGQCVSGEGGEDYERDFSFVSASPDTMTWITEGGQPEPYVRCP